MNAFFKIFIPFLTFMFLLQACGPGAEQKIISAKADSLFIRVTCVKTVSELIETTLLIPAQKKMQYKIDYINETYPDTITKAQAQKIMRIKDICQKYESLISITRQLQQLSGTQLAQVNRLSAEISRGKDQHMLQYLTFENKCADTLNRVLDSLVKKSIELGCKSQNIN